MESLLVLLLFPLIWPFIAKRIWHTTINYQEMALNIGIITVLVVGVWYAGKYGQTRDTEIWNGQVISKEREHGFYIESYQCNCRETCSGSGSDRTCTETCDTCFRDHYTVTWRAATTVGNVTFAHLDSTSSAVYLSPDPSSYRRCIPKEPASMERSYTNYVKAVPESLFNDDRALADAFKDSIPRYPRVYDFYRINRVLEVGVRLPEATRAALNNGLNDKLRMLGKEKEVNVVVIATAITDPSYRHAVENAWIGGKKNDVVIFLGVRSDGTILWTDAMTWALNSGNELLQVKLRDGLKAMGTIDPPRMVSFIADTIALHYTRPHMKDFEYLKDAIDPPLWVIIFAILLAVGGSIGLTVVFHKVDVNFFNR